MGNRGSKISLYFSLLPKELKLYLLYYVDYRDLLTLYKIELFSPILNDIAFWKTKSLHAGLLLQRWNYMMPSETSIFPRYLYLWALSIVSGNTPHDVVSKAIEFDDLDIIEHIVSRGGNTRFIINDALVASIKAHKPELFYKLFDTYRDQLIKAQLPWLLDEAQRASQPDIVDFLNNVKL